MKLSIVTDALNTAPETLFAGLAAFVIGSLAIGLALARRMRRRPPLRSVQTFELTDGSATMDGARRYVLRLPRSRMPPAGAFWSVMLYGPDGAPVGAAVADRGGLRLRRDGSLKLHVQAAPPRGAKADNWLPAPAKGAIRLVARLYWPAGADRRTWVPPRIRRIG